MASLLHGRLVSCLCLFYAVCSCCANNNTTDKAPPSVCFLLPMKHNITINITLSTLFCTNDGSVEMEVDQNHFGDDECPLSGFKPHGSTTGKYGSFLHHLDQSFPLNLASNPSHVYITILLTYIVSQYPSVLFENTTGRVYAVNATETDTEWRFCVNATDILTPNGSLPITDLFTTGPPWDLYYVELLRPFLLSLLMLGLSRM
ncbi:ORF3' protein [Mikumi yellow baboon virus 1]|uniref:ORF3' protein n=1 Tax=Mikumi yellow baboon virus 1 TaxID=1546177 RepID=A0A089G0C1_9NIDO|nr:ORF3' protein [Mikumi yellow baboon virus 1]AIP91222.1 ORF3' protein [Mikumi yellow baboon virus 1]